MKRSQLGLKGTCPSVGVLCFLVAFVVGLFTSPHANADTPPPAINATPLIVPAAVLGIANPLIVRAALPAPASRFELSKHIRDMANRVDTLARDGLFLNQKNPGSEMLHLRFESRLAGGVLQLCYRH